MITFLSAPVLFFNNVSGIVNGFELDVLIESPFNSHLNGVKVPVLDAVNVAFVAFGQIEVGPERVTTGGGTILTPISRGFAEHPFEAVASNITKPSFIQFVV